VKHRIPISVTKCCSGGPRLSLVRYLQRLQLALRRQQNGIAPHARDRKRRRANDSAYQGLLAIEPGVDTLLRIDPWLAPVPEIMDKSRIVHDVASEAGRRHPCPVKVVLNTR
jgi:hypothetical protein